MSDPYIINTENECVDGVGSCCFQITGPGGYVGKRHYYLVDALAEARQLNATLPAEEK